MISCYETGLPYSLDPYTLNTLGPDDLGGRIKLGCCAAHFRLDTKKNVSVHVTVIAHESNKLARVCFGSVRQVARDNAVYSIQCRNQI